MQLQQPASPELGGAPELKGTSEPGGALELGETPQPGGLDVRAGRGVRVGRDAAAGRAGRLRFWSTDSIATVGDGDPPSASSDTPGGECRI